MDKNRKTKLVKRDKTKTVLVIIVGIVILVLFIVVLHNIVFPPDISPSLACIAASGYYCNNLVYNHSNGNMTMQIGQNAGINWTSANFVFILASENQNNPEIYFDSANVNMTYSKTGLDQARIVNLRLPVSGPVALGKIASGGLWVQYTTIENQTSRYVQIATINVKAT